MKPIPARFDGKCGGCGKRFSEGDPIVKLAPGTKLWGHEGCKVEPATDVPTTSSKAAPSTSSFVEPESDSIPKVHAKRFEASGQVESLGANDAAHWSVGTYRVRVTLRRDTSPPVIIADVFSSVLSKWEVLAAREVALPTDLPKLEQEVLAKAAWILGVEIVPS